MKDLLTSLRASNETYNSMKHSARAVIRRAEIPLLAVIVLYKAATNLLFVPLMQQLWSLTLRFAPMHYLSNNNASDIFSSPAIILCITLIAILTAFWALYEFSVLLHGLDLARKGETIRLPALLRPSLADIRHAFLPQNWLVLVYSAVLIPFTNFFLAYNYITQLAVPEYIMGVIQANSRYYLLYLAVGAALLFLCVSWVLVLPLFVLERKSLWQSVKESFCCIRRRVFRAFLLLLRWNLSVVLRSLLLTAAVAVPLYGIIIAVGLQSTQAMFALSRAALAIEMPFFQFLIDCAITMAQCTILAMLHCRLRESLPFEPEPVQSGKHHRSTGRLLLGASVAGATLLTFALAFCYLALPRDDELLSMLGGVAPVVTAHRGYSAAAPENTLPAFQLAIDQGCEWAELDVQMTRDGVVMVTHDTSLRRCTGRNENIYDLTYNEVRKLDAGRWFGQKYTGAKVPTLEEVLDLCKGKIQLNIEIKPNAATPELEAETIRIIREKGFAQDCTITSQSYETLCKVKELAPEILIRLWACGGSLWDNYHRPTFHTKENRMAFESILQTIGYIPQQDMNRSITQTVDDFCAGRTAMLITYSEFAYGINRRVKENVSGRVAASMIPGKTPASVGWNLGLNPFSTHRDAVFQFFSWLCSSDTNLYLTILNGASASMEPYHNSELLKLYPWLSSTEESLHHSRRRNSPYRKNRLIIPVEQIERILCQALRSVYQGNTSIEEALREAQKEADHLFRMYGYPTVHEIFRK